MSLQNLDDIGLQSTNVKKFVYQMPIEIIMKKSFMNNSILEDVEIFDAQYIEKKTFENCSSLKELVLPGIGQYDYSLFGDVKPINLNRLIIKEGTTQIGTMLSGLSNLTDAIFPSTLKNLSYNALAECFQLSNLTIADDCNFSHDQFRDTKSLTSLNITLPSNNKNIGLSGLHANSLISVHLNESVEYLKKDLFSCSNCSSIMFTRKKTYSIESLDDSAFENCCNLISIDLSEQTIEEIPENAFKHCAHLTSILFPQSIRSFRKNCFSGCIELSIDLPDQLTSIENVGKQLKDVIIPSTLQNIGPSSFYNANFAQKSAYLTDLHDIGDHAFFCSDIQDVKFGRSITSIASYSFAYSQLHSFDFSFVREVGEMSFANTQLSSSSENMLFLEHVDKYGKMSFADIQNDLYIKMSPQITSDGNFVSDVFSGSNVKKIELTGLTNEQFNQLSVLAGGSLIPESKYADDVKAVYSRIKTMLGSSTDFILELSDITFDKDGELAEYICLIYDDNDKKHLSKCDNTKSDYFQFIRHPMLPSRVSAIGHEAFQNLNDLTSLNIRNVTKIETNAFSNCANLRNLTCNKLEYAGNYAFNGCESLLSIDSPLLTSIGSMAFNECRNFQILNTPLLEYAGTNSFYGCTSLQSVLLPKLTSVDANLFYGCSNLKAAVIPNADSIGQYSFSECISLTNINMPNVEFIGTMAFRNCNSLQLVQIPENLIEIGYQPFDSCESLKSIYMNGSISSIPDSIAAGIPNILSVNMIHSSMSDIGDDLAKNRFKTKVHSQFFTSDKKSIYPSYITINENQTIPITNGLIVDSNSLKVIGTDPTYRIKTVYDSDLSDLYGIEDGAFQKSNIQVTQLPDSWGSPSIKWTNIGNTIFDGENIQCVKVMREYKASTATYDRALYTKLFASCSSSPYIRFKNGSLVSSSKFVWDADPFVYDSSGEWIIGVNDENISAKGEATVENIVAGISSGAFEGSRYLNKLTIQDRTGFSRCLSVIDDAFAKATRLSSVIFESDSQIALFENTFRKSYINKIKIPGFLSVGGYGLKESHGLRVLEYSNGTEEILPSSMMDCKPLLSDVKFGIDLTCIGDCAFAEFEDPFPNIENIDFYDCKKLKSIGKYAFYNSIQSTYDRTLKFPNSITSISDAAFAYRKGYKEYHKISALDLNESNIGDIGPSAFYYNSFRKVEFGDKLTSIGQYAFAKPTYKFDVYIPSSVISIGWKAFRDNIILNPDYLKYNVMSADMTLERLSSVIGLDLSNPILSVNNKFQAITNTIGITRNTVLSALKSDYLSGFIIASAPDYSPKNSLLNFCPSNMKIDLMNRKIVRCNNSLDYAYIPNYINSISPSAFLDCNRITMLCDFYDHHIYMLSSVDDFQFCGCTNLSNIQLLSTAQYVGKAAFKGCNKLSSIYGDIDDEKFQYYNLRSIGPSAFMNCDSLKRFDMCNSVSSISTNMFDNCYSLENIFIDMSYEDFNQKFAPLPEYTIKHTIVFYFNDITPKASCKLNFRDAVFTNDGNIWLDENLVRIREYGENKHLRAISGIVYDSDGHPINGQTYLNLSSISMIDKYVFDGITNLKNINLLENEDTHEYLSSIGDYAFYNCSKLNSINNCKLSCSYVGQYAFGKCKLLIDMQFDLSKLSSIGQGAFYKTNLNSLTFIDPYRNDINSARSAVISSIGFSSVGDRNPLQLPDGCVINIMLKDGSCYKFNYLMDDLSSSIVDINRHSIVFTDKTTNSVKPLVLIESIGQESVPAIVANSYHANIIGRWK